MPTKTNFKEMEVDTVEVILTITKTTSRTLNFKQIIINFNNNKIKHKDFLILTKSGSNHRTFRKPPNLNSSKREVAQGRWVLKTSKINFQ